MNLYKKITKHQITERSSKFYTKWGDSILMGVLKDEYILGKNYGDKYFISLINKKNYDINAKNRSDENILFTLVMYAYGYPRRIVHTKKRFKLFIDAGVNVNLQNKKEETALLNFLFRDISRFPRAFVNANVIKLWYSVRKDVCEMFINAGVNINFRDKYGKKASDYIKDIKFKKYMNYLEEQQIQNQNIDDLDEKMNFSLSLCLYDIRDTIKIPKWIKI